MSDTERQALLEKLTRYVSDEVLGEQDATDLTTTTPLLEWGILNSVETARLTVYLRQEFGVRVPPMQVNAEHFKDLESITDLVTELRLGTR
ncbi:phosphopantetheine-binding protein [Actinophytocola oryzae]|uniref:Phosphopantetheine binding protein n=1 Tax=Actinophytocola oryzae TaxID=502181 RepID=A0A4R7VQS0_9PSEU|nr:phosphopantetheine-binding protein [Actinophytocola oryzae]TDV52024.1 phosphopantetheine binding protein [Actinophytocola oryzae]